MAYLQRLSTPPSEDGLTDREREYIRTHFDLSPTEIVINGDAIRWDYVEEIEVAVAARSRGPSGWVLKNLIIGGDRYHLAVYYGYNESVLTNMTHNTVVFVLKMIAYYAPLRIRYTGPDDLVPLAEF